jgi:hypothetical protein
MRSTMEPDVGGTYLRSVISERNLGNNPVPLIQEIPTRPKHSSAARAVRSLTQITASIHQAVPSSHPGEI